MLTLCIQKIFCTTSANACLGSTRAAPDLFHLVQVAELSFGPNYIIPKPVDRRLLGSVAAAVARAAVDSGVALLPYPEHYPLS